MGKLVVLSGAAAIALGCGSGSSASAVDASADGNSNEPDGNPRVGVDGGGDTSIGNDGPAPDAPYDAGPTEWVIVQTGFLTAATDLFAVSGTGPLDLWVVGGGQPGPATLHFGQGVWQNLAAPTTTHPLVAVGAIATFDAYAVAGPDLFHWDSSAWTLVAGSTNTASLTGVWMPGAAGKVWAVGAAGTTLYYDSATWTSKVNGTDTLTGVWGLAANNGWAVGKNSAIFHWDGAAWSPSTTTSQGDLLAVQGSGAADCWAVGASIVHGDGASWKQDTSLTVPGVLNGVWAADKMNAWAVGQGGIIVRWDGTTWRPTTSPTTEDLYGIWGSGLHDIWAVGAHNTVLHRSK